MHAAKQTLKVANHELAYRQIKFLDDFYEFLLSQQKKIQHNNQKLEDMETEIAGLRRTLKENKVKFNEELKNMLKFSDEQKAKIDSLNAHRSDHLEEVFEKRYKEMEKQQDLIEKEKQQMVQKMGKLNKIIDQLKMEKEEQKAEFDEK
jgi:DNA repair exonuclease SbcCD ATPase subunit